MEDERRHAYATRLQCWWRCILAVKIKLRKMLALKETPLEDVEEEAEKAALVLQVWSGKFRRQLMNLSFDYAKSARGSRRRWSKGRNGSGGDFVCTYAMYQIPHPGNLWADRPRSARARAEILLPNHR